MNICEPTLHFLPLERLNIWLRQSRFPGVRSVSGTPGFDSRPSQTKDFKLVVEVDTNGSSTQKLVDPSPE